MTSSPQIDTGDFASASPAKLAALVGVLVLGVSVVFGLHEPEPFFRAYLFAWFVCLGVAMGALGIVMLHHMTGGGWGFMIRRSGESAAMTLPILTLLFIPLVLGAKYVWPWADPERIAHSALLQHREHFMSARGVFERSFAFLILWSLLAWRLRTLSVQHDRTGDARLLSKMHNWSVVGLILYFFTMFIASVDWICAREVDWFSSTFGAMTVLAQAVTGLCVMILVLARLRNKPSLARIISADRLQDLGNLFLAAVVMWAYVSFFQYLVIWAGNSQEDNVWFYHRTIGAWKPVGISIILLHFAVPFLMLLRQRTKRDVCSLAKIAALVLVMRIVDVLWMIAPSSPEPRIAGTAHWLDFIAPFGLGGIWLAVYLMILSRQPLVPAAYDVSMQGYEEGNHGTHTTERIAAEH